MLRIVNKLVIDIKKQKYDPLTEATPKVSKSKPRLEGSEIGAPDFSERRKED